MDHISTDILIIGSGLSGMHLTLSILQEPALNEKSIHIVDPEKGIKKTWCFWEAGKGKWDDILYREWLSATFTDQESSYELQMDPYTYKMVRSEDLQAYFCSRISEEEERVKKIKGEVIELDIQNSIAITENKRIQADYIFDSSFDPKELKGIKEPTLLQHFKGWFIKTKESVFTKDKFTMMDFSSSQADECSFMYILPLSDNEALLEFTFFSPDLKQESEYDQLIKEYIDLHFPALEFEIVDTEMGVIPMSSYDFQTQNSRYYCKIGTAGGWVKPSSGYSFKMSEKRASRTVENLLNKERLDKGILKGRFKIYDKIFLSILENENELGNEIFQEMYRKNRASAIFTFLDEESTLWEELKIISKFKSSPFLRAVRRELI